MWYKRDIFGSEAYSCFVCGHMCVNVSVTVAHINEVFNIEHANAKATDYEWNCEERRDEIKKKKTVRIRVIALVACTNVFSAIGEVRH